MNNKCLHLKLRTKKGKRYFYCSRKRAIIELSSCYGCINKEYKKVAKNTLKITNKTYSTLKAKTPLKKKNHYNQEKKRYSILTNDLKHCIECGQTEVNIHEVYFGRNRQSSIKCGFCVPLCQSEHHNQIDCKGIHFDNELDLKYKKLMQMKFEETHTREEFFDIIGKNYLD